MRGFLREGICSGPENSWIFPTEVQEGKGQGVGEYDLATGWGFSWPALTLREPESLMITSGGKVSRMGERSLVLSPI